MNSKKSSAVFYHYFEANETYRENFVFFLSVAYSSNLDFFIIISESCSIDLPKLNNIKYIHTINKNNDFGGYSLALQSLKTLDDYEFYIFINSSSRGPFVHWNYGDCWTKLFTSRLKGNVHLAGSSINILSPQTQISEVFKNRFDYSPPFSHVQTTAYALSATALKHLVKIGFYSENEALGKDEVICSYELRLSQEIKRNGWNFECCLLSKYNEIDYRLPHADPNFSSLNGDPLYSGAYFGRTATPFELIFIKTNRDLISNPKLLIYSYRSLIRLKNPDILQWTEYNNLKKTILKKAISSIKSATTKRIFAALNNFKKLLNKIY